MISLTKEQIHEAIPKVKTGLDKYLVSESEIMNKGKDVSKDLEFQKKFNYFYKITPHRDKVWQKDFYSLLQKSKSADVTFESTLSKLFKKTGKLETSFIIKLAEYGIAFSSMTKLVRNRNCDRRILHPSSSFTVIRCILLNIIYEIN